MNSFYSPSHHDRSIGYGHLIPIGALRQSLIVTVLSLFFLGWSNSALAEATAVWHIHTNNVNCGTQVRIDFDMKSNTGYGFNLDIAVPAGSSISSVQEYGGIPVGSSSSGFTSLTWNGGNISGNIKTGHANAIFCVFLSTNAYVNAPVTVSNIPGGGSQTLVVNCCSNVTNSGTITYSGSTGCGSFDPPTINSTASATGGIGPVQYQWYKSTTACATTASTLITGATNATYDPSSLSSTTWFVRASRNSGCTTWSLSNCVQIVVNPAQAPGTACNDNNANTTNDVIQADGCTCAGTNTAIGCTPATIAHWNLNACVSNTGNGTNMDYSEFTAQVYNPTGATIATSIVNREIGDHSCTPGINGTAGMCVGTQTSCSAADYVESNAVKFSVTVTPTSQTTITGLQFYEKAPTQYSWIGGATGPNNYPTKYLLRVRKNGQLVYSQDNITTAQNWTQRIHDFSSDPDFAVTTTSVFTFELRAYCLVGNGAANSVWDLDEIKVLGCSQPDPCANLGGDTDGDGTCNNNDCQPNNPAYPATPGTACNDNNANTTNDVVTADGCGCAGTVPNPCANLGGDTDGDGTCNNNDCQPNNPAYPATPGTACNDNNANTTNDVVTTDGCGCAGTPTNTGADCNTGITITPGAGSITVTGLGGSPVSSLQVLNASWQQQYSCFANCGASQTVNNLPAGTYYVYAKYYTAGYQLICEKQATVTVTGGGTNPCANLGGDTDGDGTCDNNDCQPNNPAYPATPGTACNDNNASTTNDVVTADGCGCAGTPTNTGADCNTGITITPGAGSITVTGLGGSPVSSLQVLNASWQQQYSCFANCGASQTVNNLPAGTYFVYAKYYTAGYQLICEKQATVTVTGGGTNPCANLGGDTDGDGTCDNNDCQPNNPAYPATPGTACNDNNASTNNDVVTANGCGCAGTPTNTGADCNTGITITPGAGSITVTGLGGSPVSSLQVLNASWQQQYSCFANCGASQTVNNLAAGTYFVYAKYYTAGYQLICEKQATVTVTGGTSPCANLGGDTDGDGVCNNNDCQPNNPAYPATPGTACNDNNASTTNDVVTADGCGCAGTVPNPCANLGGDTDGDGVCNNNDCQPSNPAYPATPGTACNDNNANTTNDVVTADGCGCAGTGITTNSCSNDCYTFTGYLDYKAIGNSMSYHEAYIDCGIKPNSAATLSLPAGATVVKAYLQWSGTGNVDNSVTLNGQTVNAYKTFSQSTNNLPFFGAYADVTNLVQANGTYTVANLTWSNASGYCNSNSAYGAWSLVVIHTANGAPKQCEVQICMDKFNFTYPAANYSSSMGCVNAPSNCPSNAKLTIITFESDSYKGEWLYIGGQNFGDNNFRGQTAPNLDILTFDVGNLVNGNTTTLNYSINTYLTNSIYGLATEGLFDFVKVLKYDVELTPGTACNDGNANTTNDVIQADGCTCAGTVPSPCANLGGDTDGDGVCNNNDCQPNNPAYPATPGTACNDNNANTTNDVVTADGCGCAGTVPNPCANLGGDTDGDGVCNNNDCQPSNPAYPATPGTACNDNNANTSNDVVTADGCGCAGTPNNNTPDCENGIQITTGTGSISVTGLDGAPVSSMQIFTATWQPVYSCFANCGASQTVNNLPLGTYQVFAKYYTTGYQLICQKTATVTVGSGGGGTCDNVTNGGSIGFGTSCASSYQHCPNQGAAPTIGTCTAPSGGTGNLEVIWLKSTTSCTAPTTTITQIQAGQDPHWTIISGATGLSYSPGTVTQQTCYLRCARRTGCPNYVESNILSLSISSNCGGTGGGTPDCANIGITAQPGQISVTGLDGAPVTSVQVFSSAWQPEHNCFANCASPSATYAVPAGAHYVFVKYYTAGYQLICEKTETINVVAAALSQGESFQFGAVKQEEHTELFWSHNGGFHVARYVLERSSDGLDFEQISEKGSEGGHGQTLYEDFDLEPMTGDNYYRVMMVNSDGTTTYSEVQKVNFAEVMDFDIFPNPANSFVKVNLEKVIGKQDVTITVFNNLGLEVKRFQVDEVFGKYFQMDIRDMQEGYYIMWLNVPGKRPVAKKLVIGKV